MIVVIFLLFVLYFGLLKVLYTGFVKTIEQRHAKSNVDIRFLSVIVPFRNEAQHIANVLSDLLAQQYPAEKFEILLVNDHSEDNSMSRAEEILQVSAFSNYTFIQPASFGKKSAITEGVKQAAGHIIVTIDADCRVGTKWLQSIHSVFDDDKVKMVFGPVRIEPNNSLFSKMQSIEFSSLVGSGAASMAYGIPTMCNGANLAFRKKIFQEVGGYEGNEQIASGDDEFLMRKIAKKFPGGIKFNNYKEGIVTTSAQNSLSAFIAQRIRWAGKWSAHQDWKSKLLALFIFSFHTMLLVAPFFVLHDRLLLSMLGVSLICKAITEYRFLRIVNFWLNIRWHWSAFILLQVTYSLYAVVTALLALFVKPNWKGRKINL
jgi:biofilm PGA synthesis N-glycosyltransferase PgaC